MKILASFLLPPPDLHLSNIIKATIEVEIYGLFIRISTPISPSSMHLVPSVWLPRADARQTRIEQNRD